MKKITFILIIYLYVGKLNCQDPCDAKLFDRVRENVGENAKYIYGMTSTENGSRLGYGAFSMCLNKDIIYQFTAGSSEHSQVEETISLYLMEDKNPILQKILKPGEIINFIYNCPKTGKYVIRLSYKKKGKSCTNIILSKVEKKGS